MTNQTDSNPVVILSTEKPLENTTWVDSITERLVKAWDEAHEGKPWRHAAEGGATDPVLFALAEYHGERQLAEGLLERLLKDGKTTSGHAYR